jgi:hypothetical protein
MLIFYDYLLGPRQAPAQQTVCDTVNIANNLDTENLPSHQYTHYDPVLLSLMTDLQEKYGEAKPRQRKSTNSLDGEAAAIFQDVVKACTFYMHHPEGRSARI